MQLSPGLTILIVFLFSCLDGSFAQSEGDLRLANGTKNYGRLEIYSNSTWYTISYKFAYSHVPRVACRQLGLPFSEAAFVWDESIFGAANLENVLVTVIQCKGNEVRLNDCTFSPQFVQFYTDDEYLAVACKGEIIPSGQIRLVDGSDRLRGRLEIYTGTTKYGWFPFCDIGFGVSEAFVVCRELGLNTSEPYIYEYAYFGSDDRYSGGMYIAHCTGDEENITSCDKLYLAHFSNNSDERGCNPYRNALSICCSAIPGTCEPPPTNNTAEIAGGAIALVVIVLAICAGCYITCRGWCCKKKAKPPQQYTAVSKTADDGGPSNQQYPMAPVGDSEMPLYVHSHISSEPSALSTSVTQSQPAQQTGNQPTGMPPPVSAGSTPYPPQSTPYSSRQVPPPTGAYPEPHQPGYNPTAAAYQHPPQPTAPYPPQTSSMAPPYGAPYGPTAPPSMPTA